MSRYNRPLTDAERARIPADAARLIAHIEQHARPSVYANVRTLVCSRRRLAGQVSMTVRQFGCAEDLLLTRGVVTVQNLPLRNEREAADPPYRWVIPNRNERATDVNYRDVRAVWSAYVDHAGDAGGRAAASGVPVRPAVADGFRR